MELWIARDQDGDLNIYDSEPVKILWWLFYRRKKCGYIQDNEFPEVTWENSPQKVKLELID